MAESTEFQAAAKRLEELEAIKRLKYRYVRCVDTKQWDDLARCFVPDATTDYGGRYRHNGVEAIMDFMRKHNPPEVITMHQVHHPEIDLTGARTARATWALEDYVISLPGDWSLHGTALYQDEYVKLDGEWKIKHTGYQRIFSERWVRSEINSLKVTESMHTPPRK
jgi:hypothetical protein